MNRIVYLAVGLLFSLPVVAETILPAPPSVAATAHFLVEANSGHVITENNADDRLAPASLTKMMTSYALANELALGRVDLSDEVLISENAWAQNPLFQGSSLMWIEVGKRVKLEDLNRGIVISSGNDATVAVAEHIAGSEAAFADVMNGHAAALGLNDSHFVNSHGLPDPDHYTTARDLAILARALVRDFPQEYALYKEREFTYNNIRQYNRNGLLAEDPSVDGLKTGYTKEAGFCLVASAQRNGMRLVSVVLGADSERARVNESRKLLNYGFRFFESHELYRAGQELTDARVWKGQQESLKLGIEERVFLTIPRGSSSELEAVLEVDEIISAPILKGGSYGQLRVSLNGKELLNAPLVALQAVDEAGFFARLWDHILMLLAQLFGN